MPTGASHASASPGDLPGPLVPVESVRDVGAAGVAAIRAAITAAGLDAGAARARASAPTRPTRSSPLGLATRRHDALSRPRRRIAAGRRSAGIVGRSAARGRGDAPVTARHHDGVVGRPGGAGRGIRPNGYRVFVAPGAPTGSDTMTPGQPAAWPLPTRWRPSAGWSSRIAGSPACASGVTEADAAKLAPVLAAANQLTAFTSGGASFTLYVSPLLPTSSHPDGRARDAAPRACPGRGTLRLSDGAGAAEA